MLVRWVDRILVKPPGGVTDASIPLAAAKAIHNFKNYATCAQGRGDVDVEAKRCPFDFCIFFLIFLTFSFLVFFMPSRAKSSLYVAAVRCSDAVRHVHVCEFKFFSLMFSLFDFSPFKFLVS